MANSIASQLQAIKSVIRGSEDPVRRPITRPSIIFDHKEAADIDIRTILSLALAGLDVLVGLDPRFGRYRDTLFSHTSLEVDREKMVPKEEEKLNVSICSYLRLLSGHLQNPAALKTLEYLIRRYRVHVFNMDELVLCALPYHDTHAFVRIVQLLDLGNKRWSFLEGVKTSGAPPPRKVIVQQCIRDRSILETICSYATPTKEFQQSRPVICFCTAVIIEALGGVPRLDTDTVQRVLNFVFDGLNPAMKGSRDHKAGALMVVGLLATRATLAPKLIQNLILFVGRIAHEDAKEADLPWLRVVVMAMISLVQSQSTQVLPKKTMMILKDIRDFSGILSGLSMEFNIRKFLCLFLEMLVEYSISEESLRPTLVKTMENLPLNGFVEKIVFKVLGHCLSLSRRTDNSNSHDAGMWGRQILIAIDKQYPLELQAAVRKFLQKFVKNSKEEESVFCAFCHMFDGYLDASKDVSDSKIWFSLEHPKAVVRQAALTGLATSGVLKDITDNSQLIRVQDVIVRRLYDDELNVVQAALSIEGLSAFVDPARLFKVYQEVLSRCIDIIEKCRSKSSQATDIAVSCLTRMVLDFGSHVDHSMEVATILFPFLMVSFKTWRVNLKAVELAKQVQWPFYHDSFDGYDPTTCEQIKNWDAGYVASINMRTIETMAKTFLRSPQEHIQSLIRCSKTTQLSKSLYLLIILHALMIYTDDKEFGRFFKLHEACFPALEHEWYEMESQGLSLPSEELNLGKLDDFYVGFVEHLFSANLEARTSKIVIHIFWQLLQAFAAAAHQNSLEYRSDQILDMLFCFFAKLPSKNAFRKHIHFLVTTCTRDTFQFISKYFTDEGFPEEVQAESLISLAAVCSMYTSRDVNSFNDKNPLQLLLGFPTLLIPLSNRNKDIRAAAMGCIEGLHKLWRSFDVSRLKNGNDNILSRSVAAPFFGDLLESIVNQKKLIVSDVNIFSSLMTSMLSRSSDTLQVPENINGRFDQPAKDAILLFVLSSALKFSSYGKLKVLSLLKGVGSVILRVEGLKSLLCELVEKHNNYHAGHNKEHQKLSKVELETLCLLLEVIRKTLILKVCVSYTSPGHYDADIISYVIKSLEVDGLASEDEAVLQPCVTVMQILSSSLYNCLEIDLQDELFGNFISLFRNANGDIRTAARDALLRIKVNPSTIARLLEVIVDHDQKATTSKRMRRNNLLTHHSFGLPRDSFNNIEATLSVLCSVLDILLLKKDTDERSSLVQPLFKLLEKLFSDEWLQSLINQEKRSEPFESVTNTLCHAQQTTLMVLKDLCDSHMLGSILKDEKNMVLLVNCASFAKDVSTRNYVFMLLSSVARVTSGWLVEHIIEIFSLVSESAAKQGDSHSQHVLEELISTLVPCWLSKTDSIEQLLQIFVSALPNIPEHRRLTFMVYLLRTLGEKNGLSVLLEQLFYSLAQRMNRSSFECGKTMIELLSSTHIDSEWEYVFALQICNHYSCKTWLPCFARLLGNIRKHTAEEQSILSYFSMKFILHKLQDAELVFEVDSGKDANYLQVNLGELLEQVVLHLQHVHVRIKTPSTTAAVMKELKECTYGALRTITRLIFPSTFFRAITQLLGHPNDTIKEETLRILSGAVADTEQRKHMKAKHVKQKRCGLPLDLDESSRTSFHEMCMQIVNLIDCTEENVESPVKLAAITSLDCLAKAVPSDDAIFSKCIGCIVKHISSANLAISSWCLRATGSLISVLGSKALSQLPHVMKNILERAHEVTTCLIAESRHDQKKVVNGLRSSKVSILISILMALEAVVQNLSGFLNPYLGDILHIILLHPEYALESDQKIKAKADNVRKHLAEKIPVRLMINPLLKIYPNALKCGELSLSLSFDMLASMISSMERSAVVSYHSKIHEQCLLALDLRRQLPESFKNISIVEEKVINAMVTLTMKLTERMFRPLFLHSLEWAESEVEGNDESRKIRSIDRLVPFFKLVNELIGNHRSLFVPYFKYLLESCTRYLIGDIDSDAISSARRRKKARVEDAKKSHADLKILLSPKLWHLRALILKSLHKCFVYDTLEQKFLDSSNFQVLLKPIVSQFVVEPPASSELPIDSPSVEEVNELIVLCLGQMAVASHSDVLWQPLNHEVLMQTRNENVRPKILGLRVVKHLIDHLKEEYLSLMAQTVPFLAELLEDVELPVKTLAQEILKEMEAMSGENIRQYL